MKNPLTPAGNEPATLRFVAQHLNLTVIYISIKVRHFISSKLDHRQDFNINPRILPNYSQLNENSNV